MTSRRLAVASAMNPVIRNRFRPWRADSYLGLLLNAAFVGLSTVILPLRLDATGASKGFIAGFFVVSSVTAAAANATVGRRCLARGVRRADLVAMCALTTAGIFLLLIPSPPWAELLAAGCVAANTVNYAQYISLLGLPSTGAGMSRVRKISVIGYVSGVGTFGALAAIGLSSQGQVAVLLGLSLLCAGTALRLPIPGRLGMDIASLEAGPEPGTWAPTRSRPTMMAIAGVICAVVLLRAADSLRNVYLPLFGIEAGLPKTLIGSLFAVTAVVELAVLSPIGHICDRVGARRALTAVAAIGALSCAVMFAAPQAVALIAAQIFYAVFTAGFQSIGLVLVGQLVLGDLGGGAAVYVSVVQIGSLLGILAPLAVPGYSAWIFLLAAGMCAVSALILALPGVRRGLQ